MSGQEYENSVTLDGEWDLARKDELTALLSTLTKDGAATIDVRGVTYADSTMLAVLAALALKLKGVPITLLGPSTPFLRLLKIANFDQLFRIADSE